MCNILNICCIMIMKMNIAIIKGKRGENNFSLSSYTFVHSSIQKCGWFVFFFHSDNNSIIILYCYLQHIIFYFYYHECEHFLWYFTSLSFLLISNSFICVFIYFLPLLLPDFISFFRASWEDNFILNRCESNFYYECKENKWVYLS